LTFKFTFQGGKEVLRTISATAGNVTTNLSPGTGKRWLVNRGSLILQTNATVVNRYIKVQVTNGTNIIETLGYCGPFSASQRGSLNLGEGRVQGSSAVMGNNEDNVNGYIGIDGMILSNSDQLRITIFGGEAGDSYSGYFVVLEVDV